METIIQIDRSLFLFLNGKHNEWLDILMPLISSTWFWIPLYTLLAFLLYKKNVKKIIPLIIGIVIIIFLSDQTCNLIKKGVKRHRPTHNTELQAQVHVVNNYKGGEFGFVSSHAANTFAIAVILILLLNERKRSFKLSLILWACLVSYSRIYLGVHYPLDIIGGAIVGIFWSTLFYLIYIKYLTPIKV